MRFTDAALLSFSMVEICLCISYALHSLCKVNTILNIQTQAPIRRICLAAYDLLVKLYMYFAICSMFQ